MFAVLGMMLFPAAGDLLTMFVALEVLSLPLYLLCGLARRRRLLSQEASLKYFLLGAFSSAFFLFGAALLYGYSGSIYLADITKAISASSATLDGLLLPGVVFLLVGLLFKVGAVPFHSWTPDVYQGAPTPVTGFMAACTKVAAFGAILRLVYVGLEANRWDWRAGVIGVAAITMVVGSVLSVTQTDVKRLLAYSSIAHAGFILVAVLAFDKTGVSGTMFYLVAYGFMTIAAFAVVSMVRQGGSEASHLSQWAGLGRNHPVVAGVFAFLLLAFAGIPLTSGFTAKFAAFSPAINFGGRGRCRAGGHRPAVQRDHGVRLCPAHRPHVLHRGSGRRVGRGPGGLAADDDRGHRRHAGHARPRRDAGAGPRPRRALVGLPVEMTLAAEMSSTPTPTLLPDTSERLAVRLQAGLDEVDALLRREVDHDDAFIAEANAHLIEAGGKRFRPLLTLLAAELGSGSNPTSSRRLRVSS